jgi:hypothetical protein
MDAIEKDWRDEQAAICSELGCINESGVALRFVKQLREEIRKSNERNIELLRSWDPISPTDKQELDRMRRGWGPSTPTERMTHRENIWKARNFIDRAYESIIELNTDNYTYDDIVEANDGAVEAMKAITEGQKFCNDLLVSLIPSEATP